MPSGVLKRPKRVQCVDCSVVFTWTKTGVPALRCDSCRSDHVRAQDARKTARWKKAHPEQAKAIAAAAYAKNRGRQAQRKREKRLEESFGITVAQYDAMVDAQGGVCAVCGQPPPGTVKAASRLNVDHDHVTGQIRDLLCSRCNTALGLVDDDPERLVALAAYLIRHTEQGVSA